MKNPTWQSLGQLVVAQVLKSLIDNSVVELRYKYDRVASSKHVAMVKYYSYLCDNNIAD